MVILLGGYVNPTTFTIASDAKIHLEDTSRIIVKNNSTLIIEDGAEVLLDNHACIVVEETGTLHLKGNNINLNGSGAVIILKGTLKTDDDVDFTFTGSGYIDVHPTHVIDMGNNSDFVIERDLNPQAGKQRFMRIRDNTHLLLQERELRLHWGKVICGEDSDIEVVDGSMKVEATIFEGTNKTATALIGTGLNSCLISYSEFTDLERCIHLSGNNSIPSISNNWMQNNIFGIDAQQMDYVLINDNQIIGHIEAGVHLSNIDNANLTDNIINGQSSSTNFPETNDGIVLDEVNIAWIGNNHIHHCEGNGVRAHHSNVILNSGTVVSDNYNGVIFENNATAEWALSVGTCSCAHIIDNTNGVTGNNIILHIDALENAAICTEDEPAEPIDPLPPNCFDGNDQVFDICYSQGQMPNGTTILMRGNYWGPQPISTIGNYKIQNYNCGSPSSGLPIDDSDAITDINLVLADCNWVEEPVPGDGNYPSKIADKVNCKVTSGTTTYLVQEQSRIAFTDLYEERFDPTIAPGAAEAGYQPVANLDPLVYSDAPCVHKINFAKCMVNALQNDQYATPYTDGWHEEATLDVDKNNPVTIIPNPASNHLTLSGPPNKMYQL